MTMTQTVSTAEKNGNQQDANQKGTNQKGTNQDPILESQPTVELLVPVYHPGKELIRLLVRMTGQSYPLTKAHLLVTAETEEYEEIVKKYTAVWNRAIQKGKAKLCFTRISPEEFDHGGTRHRGAMESQADLLLFMTQDAVPADEYLVEKLVKAISQNHRNLEVAAAYARQLPNQSCNLIERYTRNFNYPEKNCVKTREDLPRLGIKTYFCSNVCAMYRRDVYEELGGFPVHTIFNEDMIYGARLIQVGFGIAYVADARVIHSHNYSAIQQFHRNFDLAVSQADHPEIFKEVPSEGEGIRMILQTTKHLCQTGKAYLVPKLIYQSGWKYLGYLLGKHYRSLPEKMIQKCTMNPGYWENRNI